MRIRLRNIPTRVSTGAFILHAGWEKWHGGSERAQGVHGMAAGAFPALHKVPPVAFLKVLAAAEMATGAGLLTPTVTNRMAGAALTSFGAGLITMYLRTPALHKPGSVWPTTAGTGVSKDVWLVGIGLSLLVDSGRRAKS